MTIFFVMAFSLYKAVILFVVYVYVAFSYSSSVYQREYMR